MKRRLAFVLTLAVAAGWGQVRRPFPSRFPSRGLRGAVAGGSEDATEAGMRMFLAGGNAVDAGIATMLAAAVCEFSHFGLGGEAPILVRTKEGKVFAIAGVGTMPKLATADFFRNHTLTPLEIDDPPGRQRTERLGAGGRHPLRAGAGHGGCGHRRASAISAPNRSPKCCSRPSNWPTVSRSTSSAPSRIESDAAVSGGMAQFAGASSCPTARCCSAGNIFRQPDLARTLRYMADVEKKALAAGASRAKAMDAVRDYFYRGEIARRIGEFSKQNGGLLRYEDMAAFHVAPEEAGLHHLPRLHRLQARLLEPGPGHDRGPQHSGRLSHRRDGARIPPTTSTLMAEALKLAYADRDTYYGDPKFNHIPAEALLSKEYGAERRKLISRRSVARIPAGRRSATIRPSTLRIANIEHHKLDPALLAKDTTCVDAIDKDGVAISITPSGAWMPPVIAGDTGIPLTQRAQSFLLIPGPSQRTRPRQAPARDAEPDHRGRARARICIALSTPGGDQQDQALLQVLFSAVEYGYERAERRGESALPVRAPGVELRQPRHEARRPGAGRAHCRRPCSRNCSGAGTRWK